MLGILSSEKTLLVDTHRYKFSQVDEYISNKEINQGLDDFIMRLETEKLNSESFSHCINSANGNMDFMNSNHKKHLNQRHIEVLFDYFTDYENVVIDLKLNNDAVARKMLEKSDMIFYLIDQNYVHHKLIDKTICSDGKEVYLVVNKFDEKIKYSMNQIEKNLKKYQQLEFKKIFSLPYDERIANYINDGKAREIISKKSARNTLYFKALNEMMVLIFKYDKKSKVKGGFMSWKK